MERGVVDRKILVLQQGWHEEDVSVIEEDRLRLCVNGAELATIMCSPVHRDWLALGFLKNENFIQSLSEVEDIRISEEGCCVDIWLNHAIRKPERKIITSGCGGGITFDTEVETIAPVLDDTRISAETLFTGLDTLHPRDGLYSRARGVHAAGFMRVKEMVAVVEDIGRHNTIDKLTGYCLSHGIETKGLIMLATGRISSDMIRKAARLGCPLVASRNSPTSLSVQLAERWNITLIGYVRRNSMRIYTHPVRISPDLPVRTGG